MSCVMLLDEVRQEVHHAHVVAAVTSRQKEVIPQGGALPSGGVQTLQVGAECVEQRLIGERDQAALQVQQVGRAAQDAGVSVGEPVDERAGVRRTVERPLVQVQQRQVPMVAGQRVEDTGRCGGGCSDLKKVL